MEISGAVNRRRRSLSDEKIDSPNHRVKEDEDRRKALAGLTLSAVLSTGNRPSPAQVHRTLLDIIRDDPNGGFKDNKKSWKSFRDKLRLRRAGAAWTSTLPIPASDVPIRNNNRMISRRNSTRFPTTSVSNSDDLTQSQLAESNPGQSSTSSNNNSRAMMLRRNSSRIPSLANSREGRLDYAIRRDGSLNSADDTELRRREQSPAEDEEEEEKEEEEGGGEPAVRMSLMALLAETDREMGLDGSAYMMNDEDEEDDDEEEESEGVGEYNNCCVCMVRHKGAAFIPCGHTFCRLCSRELWVQRGNCPLCNGYILEILDIF